MAEKVISAMVYNIIFKITHDKIQKTVIQYKHKNTEKILLDINTIQKW